MGKIKVRATRHRWFEGPLSFKVCGGSHGLPHQFCPQDKPHGHLWAGGEVPVSLFPVLTSKTIALQILFELCDIVTGNALQHSPTIERVKGEISASQLPDEEESL